MHMRVVYNTYSYIHIHTSICCISSSLSLPLHIYIVGLPAKNSPYPLQLTYYKLTLTQITVYTESRVVQSEKYSANANTSAYTQTTKSITKIYISTTENHIYGSSFHFHIVLLYRIYDGIYYRRIYLSISFPSRQSFYQNICVYLLMALCSRAHIRYTYIISIYIDIHNTNDK